MPAFSFVHTADLHLDSPFSGISHDNPDLAAVMRSATFEAYDNIIKLCIANKVDFLVVAGDIYDGADRSLRAQVRFCEGLKKLSEAGIQSFIVHGNHDPLSGWAAALDWPSGTHIFGDHIETVKAIRHNKPIACVQGISYPERDEHRNLSLLYKRTSPEFHIALMHANIGSDTGHEPYAPCTLENVLTDEIDYWALGHVHRNKILSNDSPFVAYPGNSQGRNIRETGEKGCYLVKVEDNNTEKIRDIKVDFHPVDTVRWARLTIPIQDLDREQALLDSVSSAFDKLIDQSEGRPVIARFLLKGGGALYPILKDPVAVADIFETVCEMGLAHTPAVWIDQIKTDIQPESDINQWINDPDFVGELLRCSRDLSDQDDFDEILLKKLSPLFNSKSFRKIMDPPEKEKLSEIIKKAEEMCAFGLRHEENKYGEDG